MLQAVRGRNADAILGSAVEHILLAGTSQESRNGRVISYPGVFVTEVEQPVERVMFNPWRKINPFLHLVDGLSVLSDIDSVVPLGDIAGRFYEFSDDGAILRGHYGKRLFSQLPEAVDMMRHDPTTRRVALSMWNAELDLGTVSKDIPCNLMVLPRIIDGAMNLTVFNRSNDLFWGMLGANVVQFSFLQEYLAAATATRVGLLTQISTNAHIYTGFGPGKRVNEFSGEPSTEYDRGEVGTMDLVGGISHRATIDDVSILMRRLAAREPLTSNHFHTAFFRLIVVPMVTAFHEYRKGDTQAADILPDLINNDWLAAGRRWLERRA